MSDHPYIEKLTQALSSPLDFQTFETLLRASIPELFKRTQHATSLQCSQALKEEFLLSLRAQIYEALKQGHLLENNYVNLWFLFSQAAIEKDPAITQLIVLFEKAYHGYSNTQKEKYIFAHLLCVLRMANGEGEQSVAWFLGEHLWFDGMCYNKMDTEAKALKRFCEQCHISFDVVSLGMVQSLSQERFLKAAHSERMGIGIWILGLFWQINGYENHRLWSERIYPKLRELFLTCKERGWIDEAMSLHMVMSHVFLNRAQTQEEFKRFNDEVEREASLLYASYPLPLGVARTSLHVKKRIALIKDRIVKNSPYMVEFSLLSALSKEPLFCQNYELIVYSMAIVEKNLDDAKLISEIKKLGFDVSEVAMQSLDLQCNFQSHLKRALAIREDMQKREIDIMIVATNNMPIGNFLFSTWSATQQVFWSHGNFEYDVDGIDHRISHFLLPSSFSYHVFSIPILETFSNPDAEHFKSEASKIRELFQGKRILGSIGRLVKMDSEVYLSALAKILDTHPDTIYLACGTGDSATIQEKLTRFGITPERVVFTGFVNPHLYGYVIDLYLDTFPLHSGESLNEYIAKGRVPVILLPKEHITYERLSKAGTLASLTRIHTFSIEDYVAVANHLLSHPEAMASLSQEIARWVIADRENAMDNHKVAMDFIHILT